jgi:hypothetical protein
MKYNPTFFSTTLIASCFMFLAILPIRSNAQYSAFPILNINGTPSENGMAGAFTALPSNSVYAAWYNPAQLGFNTDYSLAINYSPKGRWLTDGMNIWNLGARYQKELNVLGKSVQIGVSFQQFTFNTGTVETTIRSDNEAGYTDLGSFEEYDKLHAFSFGLGTTVINHVYLTVGYSIKNVQSNYSFSEDLAEEFIIPNASMLLQDWGIIADFNVFELLKWHPELYSKAVEFSFRLGYTVKNTGDTIVEEDLIRFAPSSSHLGFSGTFSIPFTINEIPSDLIRFHFSREARNNSINQAFFSYDSSILEHLFFGKGRGLGNIYQGVRLDVAESLELSFGQFYGYGYPESIHTFGITFDLKGVKRYTLDQRFPVLKPFSLRMSQSIQTHQDLQNSLFFGIEIGYLF